MIIIIIIITTTTTTTTTIIITILIIMPRCVQLNSSKTHPYLMRLSWHSVT